MCLYEQFERFFDTCVCFTCSRCKENMIVLLVPETSNINDVVVVVEDTDTRTPGAPVYVHHRYFFEITLKHFF